MYHGADICYKLAFAKVTQHGLNLLLVITSGIRKAVACGHTARRLPQFSFEILIDLRNSCRCLQATEELRARESRSIDSNLLPTFTGDVHK
jgi:hypothetical protein